MTEIELDYMRKLLTMLEAQRAKLDEIIASVQAVMEYEASTLVHAPCTRIDERQE